MEVLRLERAKPSALLSCMRWSGATDPRDKVFALSGILGRLGTDMPAVDYSKEVPQVFEEATRAALNVESFFWLFRLMDVPPLNSLYHIASR